MEAESSLARKEKGKAVPEGDSLRPVVMKLAVLLCTFYLLQEKGSSSH